MDKEIKKALAPIRRSVRGFYNEISEKCNGVSSATISRVLSGKQSDLNGIIDVAKAIAERESVKAEAQKEQLLQKLTA